jgi:uncharacterized protein (DUF488 family)
MIAAKPVLFTIGHSSHSLDEFVALLQRHGVTAVADVRSQPYSRRMEHFRRHELSAALRTAGIKYVFLGEELGARREESECYDGNQADYDRIAKLPRFRNGLDRLRQGADHYRIAIMCAEKEPLDCHRTILICRQLRSEFQIRHILYDGRIEEHGKTEKRLADKMCVTGLTDPHLTDEERIQLAYDLRAKQIAFSTDFEEALQ